MSSPLLEALNAPPAPAVLRPEAPADASFLRDLYADVRAEELAQVDWPEAARRDFLDSQFNLQANHYRQHYGGADLLVIEADGRRIGRLYAHQTRMEIRLMDVALIRELRGGGLGTRLMHRLLNHADQLGLPTSLHVEPFNPAQRLYLRLGYVTRETRGIYHFMERPVGAGQLKIAS